VSVTDFSFCFANQSSILVVNVRFFSFFLLPFYLFFFFSVSFFSTGVYTARLIILINVIIFSLYVDVFPRASVLLLLLLVRRSIVVITRKVVLKQAVSVFPFDIGNILFFLANRVYEEKIFLKNYIYIYIYIISPFRRKKKVFY